jgi:nuclear GTP-binding protein
MNLTQCFVSNCPGKSSVINTLISKKSCKVAPIPGETKIWQYVSLFKRVSLIDCPGVVVNSAGDTEVDSVLKGVVRSERLDNPEDFVDPILSKVKREYVASQYKLPKEGKDTWKDTTDLLEMIARRYGRLLKGGEPCVRSAAIMVINDFQRGRLPHYVSPPELKEEEVEPSETSRIENVAIPAQDMDRVGIDMTPEDSTRDEDAISEDEAEKEGQAKLSGTTALETIPTAPNAASLIGEGEWEE